MTIFGLFRCGQPSLIVTRELRMSLGLIRGADEACVLYTVYLFPKADDAVDPDRHRIAFNPGFEDVADFGFTNTRKHNIAGARVAEMIYSIFSYIFHAAYPAFARARLKIRWERMEGVQTWFFSCFFSSASVLALAIV